MPKKKYIITAKLIFIIPLTFKQHPHLNKARDKFGKFNL